MPALGSFALLLGLALAVYSLVAGILALLRVHENADRLGETARRAGIGVFVAVAVATVALITATYQNDFSVAYIFHHSNRALPLVYKFSALWSGQEGSLLFWTFLLSAYGFVLRVRHKVDARLVAHASVILAAVQVFFLLLVNLPANPFAMMVGNLPNDGNGLNPLLQYPEMVIHPPMLYLGYVGFTVPFAFALGALIMRYPGEKWIHITRRWTMVTWLFLSCGIVLGMHWAYSVLGWGGYWGWDPVESASFFPWLTGTAFLHSVMMQEKRGMMKVWNVWLIFCTFLLCIFGTLLTRSGIVSSVHAFAQSPLKGWFITFIVLTVAVCLFFFFKNRDHLQSENKLESLVSRESSFLFNNLLLLAACFTVLWGTLFPILSEFVTDHKITVGPPFFNRVMIPVALLLLLLTGVGPLLAWRSTSLESLKRNFTWPAAGGLGVALLLIAFGMRPWRELSTFYAWTAIALGLMVALTILSEFWRGARVIASHTGTSLAAGVVLLTRRNTRRYGGYLVHFGIVLMFLGFAGAAFNQDKEQEMGFGDKMTLGHYTLVCRSYTQSENYGSGSAQGADQPNYSSESAILDVYRGGRLITTMYPERRFYTASEQTATMVANRSTLVEDLYLVYAGRNQESERPIIRAHLNPLVAWIWIGFFVVLFGTLVALVPPLPASKLAPARAPAPGKRRAAPVEVGD